MGLTTREVAFTLHTMSRPRYNMPRARYKTLRAYVAAQPRGKALADIAADLGLTTPTLAAYLGGHRMPGREVALRLAKEHDIDLTGLLDPSLAQAS